MTDSEQTKTKITLKDSSGTSDGVEIPQKPLTNVSVPFVDQQKNKDININIFQNDIDTKKISPEYIAELKSSVSILIQKKESLQKEYKNIKLNTIRPAELAFIKSQTQYYHCQNSSSQIQDLMSRYTEIMRNNSALKARCMNLEKKIAYEGQKRSNFLDEMHLIEDTYNLSESIILEPTKITRPDNITEKTEQSEIQRLIQRLQILHNQLREIQSEPNYETNAIALEEIIKSSQIQSNLRMIGTEELTSEIESLKQEVDQRNNMIDILVSENTKSRRKLYDKSKKFYEEEKKLAEDFQNQIQKYKEKSIKDNEKTSALREKLAKIHSENQSITKEIDRINDTPKPKRVQFNSENDDEEEIIEESSSENIEDIRVEQANKQLIFTLNQQIAQLRGEVHELNQQYFFLKTNAKDSQNSKLMQIRSLNEKLNRNLAKIEKIKLDKRIAPTEKDKENIDSLAKIIGKIHGSIEEINSSLLGDNI